jgi:hypothetical protein
MRRIKDQKQVPTSTAGGASVSHCVLSLKLFGRTSANQSLQTDKSFAGVILWLSKFFRNDTAWNAILSWPSNQSLKCSSLNQNVIIVMFFKYLIIYLLLLLYYYYYYYTLLTCSLLLLSRHRHFERSSSTIINKILHIIGHYCKK